jgi:hypothetical protein
MMDGKKRKTDSKRGMALYKLRVHQIREWGAVLHLINIGYLVYRKV